MKLKINKFIFLFLVILSVLSIVYIIFRTKGSSNLPVSSPTPEPVFELLKISPNEGRQEIPLSNFAIEFTFSKKVDLSSLAVKSEPKIDLNFNLSQNGKSVFLYPTKDWIYNQKYLITLTIQSEKGEALDNPIIYTITPLKLKNSDLNESNLR